MCERGPALRKPAGFRGSGQLQFVTSPTVMEPAVGVALASLPKDKQKKVGDILGGFQVLPLGTVSAWRAGIEVGRLRKTGKIVNPIDGQIAGIALQYDASIVTRNAGHFQMFKGLKTESY
jgi:predicted nucleic acid-binding protein